MNFIKFYVFGSFILGLLETVDGVILLLEHGRPGTFGQAVSMVEFLWIPICISTLVVFYRHKINTLSPTSYLVYNITGLVIASTMVIPQENGIVVIPSGFAIIGILFGIYYMFINFQLIKSGV